MLHDLEFPRQWGVVPSAGRPCMGIPRGAAKRHQKRVHGKGTWRGAWGRRAGNTVSALEFFPRGGVLRREDMATTQTRDAPGVMTGKPLIESDRVEGTTVYDRSGNNLGSIRRLMIDKKSGRVAYAVMAFDTFFGLGGQEHTIPWNKLDYDTSLGGFRTDITEDQLRGAPTFYQDRDYAWNDRTRERELHDYWRAPYYWGE